MTVRESAFKVRLDLHGSALHIPGAIVPLSPKQIVHAATESSIGGGHTEFTQRVERLPRGISITREERRLGPSAVWTLLRSKSGTSSISASLKAMVLRTTITVESMVRSLPRERPGVHMLYYSGTDRKRAIADSRALP